MKTALIIFALYFGQSLAYAQTLKESEVPISVKETFKKQFPNSKVEKWEKDGANFEAEFDLDKAETAAIYNNEGTLIEIEVEIKVSELPKNVLDYLAKNAAGKKIKEASRITDAQGAISYEAEVGETDYLFDTNGILLKKEKEENKKEKD